jgi:hypothetical protein
MNRAQGFRLSLQPHKQITSRRPFHPEEDARLVQILTTTPFFSWDSVAQHFPGRTARQCRERWLHYLSPDVRTGPWSEDEDRLLVAMLNDHGRAWSVIRGLFNGRSENDIKNRWYSHLRFETVQEGERLALPATRPERRRRRRVVCDPKWTARMLLQTQPIGAQTGGGTAESDSKENDALRDLFAEDIGGSWELW